MIVRNILIGEDVRHEVGNKLSLMGILGSSLNVEIQANAPKEAPVAISLACLISIENTNPENDPKDFNVQISMTIGENKLLNMTGKIKSTGIDRIFHLPVPRFELGFTENTRLFVHVQVMKDDILTAENTAILDINLIRDSTPKQAQ
jgi:hypothetical protein